MVTAYSSLGGKTAAENIVGWLRAKSLQEDSNRNSTHINVIFHSAT